MQIIKARFDKMKGYAALVQNILGQIAAQGERLTALLEWRDPRASTAFCSFCAIMAVFLFFAPIRCPRNAALWLLSGVTLYGFAMLRCSDECYSTIGWTER